MFLKNSRMIYPRFALEICVQTRKSSDAVSVILLARIERLFSHGKSFASRKNKNPPTGAYLAYVTKADLMFLKNSRTIYPRKSAFQAARHRNTLQNIVLHEQINQEHRHHCDEGSRHLTGNVRSVNTYQIAESKLQRV